jgi:hypothetical protein
MDLLVRDQPDTPDVLHVHHVNDERTSYVPSL